MCQSVACFFCLQIRCHRRPRRCGRPKTTDRVNAVLMLAGQFEHRLSVSSQGRHNNHCFTDACGRSRLQEAPQRLGFQKRTFLELFSRKDTTRGSRPYYEWSDRTLVVKGSLTCSARCRQASLVMALKDTPAGPPRGRRAHRPPSACGAWGGRSDR